MFFLKEPAGTTAASLAYLGIHRQAGTSLEPSPASSRLNVLGILETCAGFESCEAWGLGAVSCMAQ